MSLQDSYPRWGPVRAAAEPETPASLRAVHARRAQELVGHRLTFPIADASIDPRVWVMRVPVYGAHDELQSFVLRRRRQPVQDVCGQPGVDNPFIRFGVPS